MSAGSMPVRAGRGRSRLPERDAVILAGGRGSRLGGVDKASLTLAGERLVDRAAVAARRAGAERVVVVGPVGAALPDAQLVREDPPLSGPLAAVAAAVPLLASEWVLLLSCDLERPDAVCDRLTAALRAPGSSGALDGCALRDGDGRVQWLAGAYRLEALRAGLRRLGDDLADRPLRHLLGGLRLREVDAPSRDTADIDSVADLERARRDAVGMLDGRP